MTRPPAVAGSFYPASPAALTGLVRALLERAAGSATQPADRPAAEGRMDVGEATAGEAPSGTAPPHTVPAGERLVAVLVPHAGLEWSGVVAAAAWQRLAAAVPGPSTTVILGTNHSAWLEGVGVWPEGAWRTPLGDVPVDREVADAIEALGTPFAVNPGAHLREHSIEVQLPLLRTVAPEARIVPLAVSAGTGHVAVAAGERLGRLIAALDTSDRRIVIAISTDLAHYPSHADCVRVTEALLPSILAIDPPAVAATDRQLARAGIPGLACGMCGIEPTVLGLAALRAAGATRATMLAAATSADAGGPTDRTVGYLGVAFARAEA